MKYKFVIVTTFRKQVEIEAESEDEALDLVVDELDDATDTLDFDTEIETVKQEKKYEYQKERKHLQSKHRSYGD